MTYTDILYEKNAGVAWITINRPQVRNAFRTRTVAELTDAFEDARFDRAVGVVAGDRTTIAHHHAAGAVAIDEVGEQFRTRVVVAGGDAQQALAHRVLVAGKARRERLRIAGRQRVAAREPLGSHAAR